MPDRETSIELMNEARYFLPHLLALSTSSPFWMGRNTGLKSYRTTVFRRFPRTGIPSHFGSWSEYASHVELVVDTRCIDDGKRIWWDMRPHPSFGTLEFRISDVPTRPRDTIAIAALAQAIVVKLYRLRSRTLGFRTYRRALIEENKWRAARWGLSGSLIDFGRRAECRCGGWRSGCSSSSTTSWTTWGAVARPSTCTRLCGTAPAPTGSSRSTKEGRPRRGGASARR